VSEYLIAAAEAMGLPEALVERSAEARAEETGASVDEILQAWAGGETVSAAAPAKDEPTEEAAVPEEEDAAPQEPADEPEPVAPAAAVEVAEPAPAAAPTRAPLPETVTPGEAARLPEVVTVPTAGIKEKTNFAIPKWLTAVLLVAPLFALFALGGSATGECGEATELRVDVVTGEIVNCDGTEFTGQAAGGGDVNFVGLGEDIYLGGEVTGVNCSSCHGAGGQGGGAFPALTGVMNTFGSCEDHVEWVSQGSQGFRAMGLNTYGDTSKQIAGGMPTFSGSLSAEQIAAVVAFERVRFGGADTDAVLADCGLVEPEEGDAPADGEGDSSGDPGSGGTDGDGGGDGGGDPGSGGTEASAGGSG
jgi:mono/diheme cytochrome c family protein